MNNQPKHTPGPWSVVSSPNVEPGPYFPYRVAGRYADLARISTEANARLIAAAPELLAACELAIEIFEERLSQTSEMKIVYDAIAKATGGAE